MCALVGHCRRFIEGFAGIAQPLSDYLTGEGASGRSEHVSLLEDALGPFGALGQACVMARVLVFADYARPFLQETDVSKDGLGEPCCPRGSQTDDITQSPMVAGPYAS